MPALPAVYFFHMMSFLFVVVAFIARVFGSAALISGFTQHIVLIRRVQTSTISFLVLFPFRQDFVRSRRLKLKAITLICISLFRAISRAHALNLLVNLRGFSCLSFAASSTDFLWLAQIWIQSTWFLLERGCTSVMVLGRLGFRLWGHLLRWLLLHLWNIGFIRAQAFRHDARTRFELATSSIFDRFPIHFFGHTLGLGNFFDPWIARLLLLLASLPPSMEVTQDESYSSYSDSPELEDSLASARVDHADYGTCHKQGKMDAEHSKGEHVTLSYADTSLALSSSYASSITLVLPPTEIISLDFPTATETNSDVVDLEEVLVEGGGAEQLYDPLSLFDCKASFMQGLYIDQVIGVGSFGTVYRGCKPGGKHYALKILKQGPRDDLVITLEVAALKRARGNTEWAAQLEYLQISNDHILLAMTYYPGGSMLDILEACNGALAPEAAKFVMAQLILAVHSVHILGIIHHDIKLDNIIVDDRGNVKLIDFGLSVTFDHDSVLADKYPEFVELREFGGDQFPLLWVTRHNPHTIDHSFGTEGYTAPEVWEGEPHSYGVDYFGAACVYHWLITGTAPFEYDPETDDFAKDKVYVYWEEFGLSDDEHSFLSSALHGRPHKRLTVSQMKNHPLFHDMDWHALEHGGVESPININH